MFNNDVISVGVDLDTSEYDNGIKKMSESTEGLGKKLVGKAGLAAALLIVGNALIEVGKAFIKANKQMADFQAELKNTNKELRNNSVELEKTTQRLVAISSATGIGLEEIAQAQAIARRSNMSLKESIDAVNVSSVLASKYNIDLAETTEAVGGAVINFGADADEIFRNFNFILENTNADAGELADIFGELSTLAKKNGKDMQEVTIDYVAFVNQGYKAEEAVQLLTTAYEKNEGIIGDTKETMEKYRGETESIIEAQKNLELSMDELHTALFNELSLWMKNTKAAEVYRDVVKDLTNWFNKSNELDAIAERTGISRPLIKKVQETRRLYDKYIREGREDRAHYQMRSVLKWGDWYGEQGNKMVKLFNELGRARQEAFAPIVDTDSAGSAGGGQTTDKEPENKVIEQVKEENKKIENEKKRHKDEVDKIEKEQNENSKENAEELVGIEKFKHDATLQLERALERGLQAIYNQAVKNGEINVKNMVALMLAEVGGVAFGGSIEAGIQGMRAMAQSVTMVRPAKTKKRKEAADAFKLSAKMGAIAAGLGVAANALYDTGDSGDSGESGAGDDYDSGYNAPPQDIDEGASTQPVPEKEVIIIQGVEWITEPLERELVKKFKSDYNVDITARPKGGYERR
jgi:predicted  nucleic acid-binding Zn-ribbon protein